MKKIIYKIWAKFLTWFGDLKIFRYPLWIVWDPDYFKMSGKKILEVVDLLQPGDIILRGFDCYADGRFIPDKLKFSHGAIYAGNHDIIHAVAEGVSMINVVEFCECDRIAVFRPHRGQDKAVQMAKKFLEDNVPYDFSFEKGSSALYCFELCKECYLDLDIPTCTVKHLFGLVKKNDVVLAESFFKSPDMKCIFHYNPRFNIDE